MRDQKNHQPIIPVQLLEQENHQTTRPQTPSKNKLAARIQFADTEVRIYNDIDKYILYALLKELKK